jgi:2-oxo-4-hydroxy-4-carboxy--5-ureidoimidazoline (OHCU) decarboxylase
MDVGTLDVAFESVLAQAQKLTATSSMEQALAFFANAAAANPAMLDVLNFDEMGKAYLERIGVPDACIRDESDIAAVRQQRAAQEARMAEQEQALAQSQQAVDVTAAAKNLGQTPTGADGQTLMGTLLGGIGVQ